MKNFIIIFIIVAITGLFSNASLAQTENYKKGVKAMKKDAYHTAMIHFTKVIAEEKYEIGGKELALTYAYLAIIRTAYLEKDLANYDFMSINQNQGQILLTIQEMAHAIRFQNTTTAPLIQDSKDRLISLSHKIVQVIGDSLIRLDENKPNDASRHLAKLVINQFSDLETIAPDSWQVFDLLGLAHYHLGNKITAIEEFEKARAQFDLLEIKPESQLHLQNYMISADFYFNEQNNKELAYQIGEAGSSYAYALIQSLGDDQMNDIFRLNKIEYRLRTYVSRLEEKESSGN